LSKQLGTTFLRDPETPEVDYASRRSLVHRAETSDVIFARIARSGGIITVGIMVAVGLFLGIRAQSSFADRGFEFLTETAWMPETGIYGIAAVLFGTVSIAIIALAVSFPLALGTSLLISEVLPPRIKALAISLVDLMAAVPSVIFGIWGVFFLQANIIPISNWVSSTFGFIPFLAVTDGSGNPLTDPSAFTSSAVIAGVVVGLMVVPTQTSVMREGFSQTPIGEKEGALALGSTKWGMIRAVVLPFGRGAMIGGTMLGLGRALGETIAVYMIISPIFEINPQIFKSGTNSVSALIALRYGEASDTGLSALMAAGLVLFLITLVINFSASSIVAKSRSGAESD